MDEGNSLEHATMMRNRQYAAALGTLVIAGTILRFRYLWTHHLWNDELATMRFVESPVTSGFEQLGLIEGHPPLFFVLIKGVDVLFLGALSADQLKYIGLAWLLLVLPIAYFAGIRRSLFRVPLLAGVAGIAVGPVAAYIGAEARPYSLFVPMAFLLLVLSLNWASRIDEDRTSSNLQTMGLAVVMTLAAGTLYAGALLSVSLFLSLQAYSLVTSKRFDMPLLRAGIGAAILFIPFAPLALSQLDNEISTASTPWPEVSGYLALGIGALGTSLALIAILRIISIPLLQRAELQRPSNTIACLKLGVLLTAAFALFVGGAWGASALTDVQVINLGVSVVPAFMLVTGLAFLAQPSKGLTLAAIAVFSAITLPIAIETTDDPTLLRTNRISNVDILVEVAPIAGFLTRGGEGTMLVSLDGALSNDYFDKKAREYFPSAAVQPVPVHLFDSELGPTIAGGLENPMIRQIVLITRYGFDYRVKPYIPAGLHVVQLHDYAWLIERA